MVVVGSATSNQNSLRLWWSSTGGVSDRESQGALQVDVLPDFSTRYWRENTATLTCTSDGTAILTARDSADTDRVKLTVDCEAPPEVSITGFDGDSEDRTDGDPVVLLEDFVVSPSSASCSHSWVSGVGSQRRWRDSSGSGRRLEVEISALEGTSRVRVSCDATGYEAASAEADFEVDAPEVSISGFGGASRNGPGPAVDPFSVWPGSASCVESLVSGLDVGLDWVDDTTTSRRLRADSAAVGTGAAVVSVRCSKDGYVPDSDEATFTFRRVAVSVTGVGNKSGTAGGDAVAQGFNVDPDTASCDAEATGSAAAVATGSGSRRTVSVSAAGAGTYTVTVECSATHYDDGSASARYVFAEPVTPPVVITGFDGDSEDRTDGDPVVLLEDFVVSPSSASCSHSWVSGVGSQRRWRDSSGSGRRLEVEISALEGTSRVRVSCDATGYEAASAEADFEVDAPEVSISGFGGASRNGPGPAVDPFSVWPGSASCVESLVSGLDVGLDWVDDTTTSRRLRADSAAVGTGAAVVSVRCSKDGYVPDSDEATFTFRRVAVSVTGVGNKSGTAGGDAVAQGFNVDPDTASCDAEATGSAAAVATGSGSRRTVSVSAAGAGTYTVTVECSATHYDDGEDSARYVFAEPEPPPEVSITGFDGDTRQLLRPGTVTLSDGFDVWPSDAVCTSDQVNSGTQAWVGPPVGSGSRRTVSVTVIDSDAAVVEVECSRPGYVTASRRATFVALAPSVSITAVLGDTLDGPGAMTGSFTVSPSWARCSAEHWSGITAEVDPSTGTTASRTVSVDTVVDGTPRTGALRVRVSCDATGYETATATALFSARRIAVEVVGFVDASGDADNDAVESFLARPDTASCTAARVSGDPDADVAIADTSNRDEGLVGHWTVRVGSDVVGAVGVEVRCTAPAYYAGTDTESFVFAALPAVSISDPVGGSRDGPGTMTGSFTVAPETAVCTSGHASGIAAAVGAPAGADTATRTVGVDTVVGGTPRTGEVSVRVSCSLAEDPSVTDTRVLSFEARRVAVSIVGLRGEVTADAAPPAGEGFTVAPAAEGFLVMPVGAHCTPTVVSGDENAVAVITEDSDEAALRLLSVTSGVAGTVGVQVRCTAAAYHDGTDTVDVVFAALAVVVISGFEGAVGSAADLSGGFGVSPASASCRRVFEGIDATVTFTDDDGADRVVRVAVTGSATGKVTVTVTCTATRHVSASATAEFVRTGGCSTDLGLLEAGTVTRSGTLSATDGCRSWVRGSESSPNHARRYTLRVPAASRITVDASSSAVDLYLYALRGSGAAAQVLGSDNNSGSANTGDARLAEVPVAAGVVYVIEVTTSTARDTGAFTLTVLTAADLPLVRITGLGSRIEPGFGTVTVDEGFTVDPPTAVCSSSPLGVVTEGAEAADRTLSADLRVGTTTAETVTCSADGYADGTQNVQLSARSAAAVSNVSVTATARGSCTPTTAAGFDKAYACTMTRGDSLEVSAAADANTGGARIGWAAAGGVSVVGGVSRPAALVSSPDGAVSYWQSARTATVGCTATGTATVTVTLADAADYTAQVTVACDAPAAVLISGLDDTDHSGDASAPVSDSFEVTPGTAGCSASSTAGTATVTGTGNRRTVTAAVASGTTATVTVSCSQAPLAGDSESALFSGEPVDGCNDPLGSLAGGITSASGVIAADAACISTRRHRIALGWAYYTRRHTFTLTGPATVTIDLGDDRSDTATLDTFVVLIAGDDAAAGARIGADDDGGARGTDSRLSDVDLAQGVYTIEATTYAVRATGAYTLAVDVAYDSEVVIDGPEPSTLVGDVAVSGAFTVTPAAATCTAASTVGTATITPDTGATRTVTLPMVAPASAVVTVICRADGHADGTATAVFAVTEPAEVASVTLASGGACTAAPGDPPDGIDQAFGCTVDEGGPVTVDVTAVANHAAIAMGWTTSGSDVVATAAAVPAATSRPDGDWQTTAAADLSCTADGTATLTVTAGSGTDVDTRLTRLAVTCRTPVAIEGLADTTEPGSGTVAVVDAFTVDPDTARCSALPVGTVTEGTGAQRAQRTLTVSLPAGTSSTVTVTCTSTGNTDGVEKALFTADAAVEVGSVTVTGGEACTAAPGDLPDGVDAAFECAVALDGTAALSVTAAASHAAISLAWTTASDDVTVTLGTVPDDDAPGLDGHWHTTTAATLGCTAAGAHTATLTVTAGTGTDTDTHITRFTVVCGTVVSLDVGVSGDHCSSVSPAPVGAHSGYWCPLSDEHRLVLSATADASSRDISLGWSAGTGVTVVSRSLDAVAPLAGPDGVVVEGSWTRSGAVTVSCTAAAVRTVTLTATAGSGDDAVAHVSVVSVDCADQGAITGLDDSSGSGTGTVTVTDEFTVSPAAAVCTADATAGRAGVTAGTEGSRTARVRLDAVAGSEVSSVVSVDCTPPGHAPVTASAAFVASYGDPCDSPLGVLGDGVTERSGTIATSTRCRSPQRWTDGGTASGYYARRHTFELINPATVTIDLESASSNRRRLDTYVLLQQGAPQDGTGTVLGRNDDRAPGDYDSRIAGKQLAPGIYTIEATAYGSYRTGDYDLTVTAQLEVLIEGLDGGAVIGTGTARDYFTVTPADASCTPGSGTVTDVDDDGRRVLSVGLTALGDTDVTVECAHDGYTAATSTSTLRALVPVSSVEVDADSGGTCADWTGTLDAGVDQKYACTMTRGDTLVVGVEASGPSSRMTLGWAAGTGVTFEGADGDLGAAVLNGAVQWTREGTGGVTCTSDADVTLTVSIDGVVEHTTVLAITCVPPVEITSYVPGSRDGAGAMSGSFDVAPATADCSASNAWGISGAPSAGGSGVSRTVSVSTTDTGRLGIQVSCENVGYATAAASAAFVARPASVCVSPLGTLAHATRTVSGTLSTASCATASRDPDSSDTFYVRRHTFTLATSGWVGIDAEATGTGTNALDTYVVLLDGHGSGGQVAGRDDNSGTGDNARLSEVFLASGRYTIEATTATAEATGGYRLMVAADFAPQSDDLPATVTATVGLTAKHRFDYRPHDATVTVQSVSPQGLTAAVTALHGSAVVDLTPDKALTTTVTLAFTASGHTGTETITVTSYCQTGYRASPDGTCQPLTPELDESCFQTLPEGRTDTFGRQWRNVVTRDLYAQDCDSVSVTGKTAGYFRFDIPADETSRSSYGLQIDFMLPANAHPIGIALRPGPRAVLPELSVIVWPLGTDGVTAQTPPLALSRSSAVAGDGSALRLSAAGIGPGSYVVETAVPPATSTGSPPSPLTTNRFVVAVTTPSVGEAYEDVQQLGNIWLDGAGATLDEFLDARGTTNYGESSENPTNNDDLFDPDSPHYPWLSFSVDKCSIPEGVVAAGDAVLDRLFAALWGDWSGIFTGEIDGTELEDLIRAEWFRDYPHFGSAEVAFVYACMRHDFNWKNLHRMSWLNKHTTEPAIWTEASSTESNLRMLADLEILCNANRESAIETSDRFDWRIMSRESLVDCERTAYFIRSALDLVPVSYSSYDWGTL